jgi:hypothetical protein
MRGPVGKYACRVICERQAPYRCYLQASGFTPSRELFVPKRASQWVEGDDQQSVEGDREGSMRGRVRYDALPPHGVRVWSPETGQWAQVSVEGRTRVTGPSTITRGEGEGEGKLHRNSSNSSSSSNELVDGSIIDLGGALLLFRKTPPSSPSHKSSYTRSGQGRGKVKGAAQARGKGKSKGGEVVTVKAEREVSPRAVLRALNKLRPQCPVLMHTIHFPAFLSPATRGLRMWERIKDCPDTGMLSSSGHNLTVPLSDFSGIDEGRVPYVFTACGHVHGYSQELEGHPCPLCRTKGPYVPLVFPFDASICAHRPTHVFSPCGHAASLSTCRKWAGTILPDIFAGPRHRAQGGAGPGGGVEGGGAGVGAGAGGCPMCPFCLEKLDMGGGGKEGRNGFSKLMIQFDVQGGEEDEEEEDLESEESEDSEDSSRCRGSTRGGREEGGSRFPYGYDSDCDGHGDYSKDVLAESNLHGIRGEQLQIRREIEAAIALDTAPRRQQA